MKVLVLSHSFLYVVDNRRRKSSMATLINKACSVKTNISAKAFSKHIFLCNMYLVRLQYWDQEACLQIRRE